MIVVLDFGSQYTQLIAKVFRNLGYSCEVLSGRTKAFELQNKKVSGIIFSGSPMSVGEELEPDAKIFDLKIPVLALCYGYHFIAKHFGGDVQGQSNREYGEAFVEVTANGVNDPLLKNFPKRSRVWMSHGDSVTGLPAEAQLILKSDGKPAGFSMVDDKLWALQFHPEVAHSVDGAILFKNFAQDICGLNCDWIMDEVLSQLKLKLKEELKDVKEVYCAVSGGVDSTVLAMLLSQVVKVNALFVDHGFLRSYDWEDLMKILMNQPNINLKKIDAQEMFWNELDGVSDPEQKRKIIGRLFMEAFYSQVPQGAHLAQGTIYSDVIESAANDLGPSHKIKSHHNVGGLPENLKVKLVEPLRCFFKDEVRAIGKKLGIADEFLERHPFPGPGLAIRFVGALKRESIALLQRCDEIFHRELKRRKLYTQTWQAFTVLLPVSSVGVMGDARSYESTLVIRCVSSLDAMTAEASELPWSELKGIASKIINEVSGVNRVVYDLTSKPPGTIEWE